MLVRVGQRQPRALINRRLTAWSFIIPYIVSLILISIYPFQADINYCVWPLRVKIVQRGSVFKATFYPRRPQAQLRVKWSIVCLTCSSRRNARCVLNSRAHWTDLLNVKRLYRAFHNIYKHWRGSSVKQQFEQVRTCANTFAQFDRSPFVASCKKNISPFSICRGDNDTR